MLEQCYKEPLMQGNGLNNVRTIVSDVLSFVGNPVDGYHGKETFYKNPRQTHVF